jgi:hypothetical protein
MAGAALTTRAARRSAADCSTGAAATCAAATGGAAAGGAAAGGTGSAGGVDTGGAGGAAAGVLRCRIPPPGLSPVPSATSVPCSCTASSGAQPALPGASAGPSFGCFLQTLAQGDTVILRCRWLSLTVTA